MHCWDTGLGAFYLLSFVLLWWCIFQIFVAVYLQVSFLSITECIILHLRRLLLGEQSKCANFYVSTLKKCFWWKGLLSQAAASVCKAGEQNNFQFCLIACREKENPLLQIMGGKICQCFHFCVVKWLRSELLFHFSYKMLLFPPPTKNVKAGWM